MEGYNVPKDEGYKVENNYGPVKQTNVVSSGYSGSQSSSVILPIYKTQEQPNPNGRSKCPRGARLGEIGSCCGMACTRACAIATEY